MILNERPRDKAGRFTRKTKYKTLLGITFILIIVSGAFWGLVQLLNWHDDHEVVFNRIIEVETNPPWTIQKREKVIIRPVVLEASVEVDTPLEQMICETFGQFECKTAIMIARCESGLNPEAIAYEPNGTFSIGVFQINQVQFERVESIGDLFDQEINLRIAKEIFDEQGWQPWTCAHNLPVGAHL